MVTQTLLLYHLCLSVSHLFGPRQKILCSWLFLVEQKVTPLVPLVPIAKLLTSEKPGGMQEQSRLVLVEEGQMHNKAGTDKKGEKQ